LDGKGEGAAALGGESVLLYSDLKIVLLICGFRRMRETERGLGEPLEGQVTSNAPHAWCSGVIRSADDAVPNAALNLSGIFGTILSPDDMMWGLDSFRGGYLMGRWRNWHTRQP
jgi:hypothetical protein